MKSTDNNTEKKKTDVKFKILIVIALIISVATIMAIKNGSENEVKMTDLKLDDEVSTLNDPQSETVASVIRADPEESAQVPRTTPPLVSENPKQEEKIPVAAIPKLVDLGAKSCIPCKMMAPILEGLREEYEGRFDVVFIDVWEDNSKVKEYGIRVIPTQIFYDAQGRELLRHEGFFSKEDILGTWDRLGISFGPQG